VKAAQAQAQVRVQVQVRAQTNQTQYVFLPPVDLSDIENRCSPLRDFLRQGKINC
jgi:hypothetical protein